MSTASILALQVVKKQATTAANRRRLQQQQQQQQIQIQIKSILRLSYFYPREG
jgi:hypothetical protein